MARISKSPDERKDEIIRTAQALFIEQGFIQTKVSDIVKSINVSQGVFYYYFKSKDEIIDEIVDRYMEQIVSGSFEILKNSTLNKIEKLKGMAENQLKINMIENNRIHSIKGVDIHEKVLGRLVNDYVPLMVKCLNDNEDDNQLNQEYLFMMEIFVSTGNVLFDPGIFKWSKEEKNDRIDFIIKFMEKSFDLKRGTFSFYRNLMGYIK